MKFLFLIADGMGDWPHEAFGNQTALEAAHTPWMDTLAKCGIMGMCQTVPQGMEPGSDVANMALLGFSPKQYHTGRGPIEAAAQGLELAENDLVWRCNLVSLSGFSDAGIMRDYSAGHIATEQATDLISCLQEELGSSQIFFRTGVQYRHLLVQKGGADKGYANLRIRPPHDILDRPICPDLKAMREQPDFFELVQRARHILSRPENSTAANSIWPWGQGRPLMLPDFFQTFGLRGAVVSAVDLVRGLGRAAGMEIPEIQGATGLIDTNYDGKVQAALDFLEHGDFVYLHVEAPDECGHMGDPDLKKRAIELFDERVVAPVFQALGEQAVLVMTCDHFTPLQERTHTCDPVPFAICGPGIVPDSGIALTERSAGSTGLSLGAGADLLPFVLQAAQG